MTGYPSLKYLSNPFSSLQVWCRCADLGSYCLIIKIKSWGFLLPILCPSNLSIWLWAEWSLRHNVHYNVLPSLHAVPYTGNLAISITFKPFTCHSGFHLCLFESSFIIINNNSKEKEGMEKEGGARGRRAGRRHLSYYLEDNVLGVLHWLYPLHNNLRRWVLLTP